MKKFLAVLFPVILIILFNNCKKSDFGTISGIVTDSITHKPISEAIVYLVKPSGTSSSIHDTSGNVTGTDKELSKASVKTASDGKYVLDETDLGDVILKATSKGYNLCSKKAFIVAGRTTSVNLSVSPAKPKVETGKVSNITDNSALVYGSIKDIGIDDVTQYGHCWSLNSNPSITNFVGKTSKGMSESPNDFSSSLTALSGGKKYYVRTYATNSAGTSYGKTIVFKVEYTELSKGLILYYPFDNSYNDESGEGLTSIWPDWGWPSFVTDHYGNPTGACRFYNSCDLYGNFDVNGFNDFTASLWFYKSNIWENEKQHLFAIGESGDNRFNFGQNTTPNCFYSSIIVNSIEYKIAINSPLSVNTWHHVLAKRQGATFTLYVDGSFYRSIPCPLDYLPAPHYVDIGCGWIFGYTKFVGDIDEVRVYDRALSNAEIKYLSTH